MKNRKVTTPAEWARLGLFEDEDELMGAMKLAHQQALDGCGDSVQAWLGLDDEEFAAWMSDDCLLPKLEDTHGRDLWLKIEERDGGRVSE